MELEPPFPWMKNKPDTFQYHLDNDTGSAFEYTRSRRRQLGSRLLAIRRVYLDTKYWVYIRDVYMGRPQKATHVAILDELRRLRRTAQIICPVSYSVFNELLSQSDHATRIATAQMIDELSDDCTIQPVFELFKAELYHFHVKSTKPNVPLRPVAESVWTKVAFIVGDMFFNLDSKEISQAQAEAMTKAMDDMLWETRFSEMIDATYEPSSESPDLDAFAAELTEGKLTHWNPKESFRTLYLAEIWGGLDAQADVIGDFIVHLGQKHGVDEHVGDEQKRTFGQQYGRVIHAAFAYNRLTTEFPTIAIPAALHAAVRLDRSRRYKKGDVEDFFHAATAVGYFDVFLTENSLKHLLLSKNVNAAERYGCTILAKEEEVIHFLRSIH